MISTGSPSSVKGISSSGTIFDIIPLFQCLQDILSHISIFLVEATYTFTFFNTFAGKSSHLSASRITTSITFQDVHAGKYKDVSLTAFDLSQNIACISFSSGVKSHSDFGVTFQTKISPPST
jgi:hypothetical protein